MKMLFIAVAALDLLLAGCSDTIDTDIVVRASGEKLLLTGYDAVAFPPEPSDAAPPGWDDSKEVYIRLAARGYACTIDAAQEIKVEANIVVEDPDAIDFGSVMNASDDAAPARVFLTVNGYQCPAASGINGTYVIRSLALESNLYTWDARGDISLTTGNLTDDCKITDDYGTIEFQWHDFATQLHEQVDTSCD
jgi:hypothetical protein